MVEGPCYGTWINHASSRYGANHASREISYHGRKCELFPPSLEAKARVPRISLNLFSSRSTSMQLSLKVTRPKPNEHFSTHTCKMMKIVSKNKILPLPPRRWLATLKDWHEGVGRWLSRDASGSGEGEAQCKPHDGTADERRSAATNSTCAGTLIPTA